MAEVKNEVVVKKSPFKSRTVWAAVIVAVAGFYPPVAELIKANPEAFSAILGFLFGLLRFDTETSIKQ